MTKWYGRASAIAVTTLCDEGAADENVVILEPQHRVGIVCVGPWPGFAPVRIPRHRCGDHRLTAELVETDGASEGRVVHERDLGVSGDGLHSALGEGADLLIPRRQASQRRHKPLAQRGPPHFRFAMTALPGGGVRHNLCTR